MSAFECCPLNGEQAFSWTEPVAGPSRHAGGDDYPGLDKQPLTSPPYRPSPLSAAVTFPKATAELSGRCNGALPAVSSISDIRGSRGRRDYLGVKGHTMETSRRRRILTSVQSFTQCLSGSKPMQPTRQRPPLPRTGQTHAEEPAVSSISGIHGSPSAQDAGPAEPLTRSYSFPKAPNSREDTLK